MNVIDDDKRKLIHIASLIFMLVVLIMFELFNYAYCL